MIDIKLLSDEVETRLRTALPDVAGYQGEAVDVPLIAGSDGRAERYWVLHPSPGTPTDQQDVGDTVIDLDWLFQVTVAAGEMADLEGLISDVHAALFRWAPVVEGLLCGGCKPPFGFNPGPVQLDRSVSPHRPYVPLQYVSTVTES